MKTTIKKQLETMIERVSLIDNPEALEELIELVDTLRDELENRLITVEDEPGTE